MSTANLDCTTAAQRMHEFLDGELADDLRPAMERHLAGCVECSATLAQLRRLENAHHQLDTQLKPPPETYWHHLPQQVMERVRASERRRLLALPRLPRFKAPVERAPASNQLPQSNMLHLPPAVRTFLNGPLKYVLPLAAVTAFCFFMIRELRRNDGLTMKSTMQAVDSMSHSAMAPKENESEETDRTASIPQEQTVSSGRLERKPDSLTIAATLGSDVAGGSGAIALNQSTESIKPFNERERSVTSPPGVSSFQPALPQDSMKITPPSQALAKAEDQPGDTMSQLAQGEVVAEYKQVADMAARDDRAQQSQSLRASTHAVGSRVSSLQVNRPASTSDDAKFSQTLQRAQQTANLNQREKIWRDFLKSNSDSAHRSVAIFHLAETLAAASDSTSTPDELEKNIAFFRDNPASIRPHMGDKEFDRELARLQTLLTRRKASFKN